MDTPLYVLEFLVRERLAGVEAWAARQALAAAHRPPRRPLRVALGLLLIRACRRLAPTVTRRPRGEWEIALAATEEPPASRVRLVLSPWAGR